MTLKEKLIIFKEKGWTYDPITGDIFSHTGLNMKGTSRGYIYLGLFYNKKTIHVYGHQLAWYLTYDQFPPSDNSGSVIDHMNHIPLDNRICNLRIVTEQINNRNRSTIGVYKRGKRYYPYITLDKIKIHLGAFKSFEEAKSVRLQAEKDYFVGKV